jgi:hypothetical protein
LPVRCACLLDHATRGVERRRTLQVGAEFLIQDRRLLCKWAKIPERASFPLVFDFWTGSPGSRIKMLQQKLVHAIIRGVSFQQHFANVNFVCDEP